MNFSKDKRSLEIAGESYGYKMSFGFGDILVRLYENEKSGVSQILDGSQGKFSYPAQTGPYKEADLNSVLPHQAAMSVILQSADETKLTRHSMGVFTLHGSIESDGFRRNLPHVIYNLTEEVRLAKMKECTLHAAAVTSASGPFGILILGDKGSGKTLTAYELCRTYQAALIGNDSVVIGLNQDGGAYLNGGTTSIAIRRDAAERSFPELGPVMSKLRVRESGGPAYENKIICQPNELGLAVYQGKIPIGLVVRVSVHPSIEKSSVQKAPGQVTEALRLHQNLGSYIRGVNTPLSLGQDGTISGYFPSLDCEEFQQTRSGIVKTLLDQPIFYVSADTPVRCAQLITTLAGKQTLGRQLQNGTRKHDPRNPAI
jgi:hypothetical protein